MADPVRELCEQGGFDDGSMSNQAVRVPEPVTEFGAVRSTAGEAGDKDWVDDLMADLESSAGAPVVPGPQECQDKGPEVFGLFDETSPLHPEGSGVVARAAPGESAEPRKDLLEDWYMLGSEDAKDVLSQQVHCEEGAASPGRDGTRNSGAPRSTTLWHSASALGRKASRLSNQARKALVEEAKLVVEDVKELSSGVREGVQLTAQDAKKISEQLKREAKHRGWLGGVLGGGNKKGDGPQANAESSSVTTMTPRDDAIIVQPNTTGDFAVVEETVGSSARGTHTASVEETMGGSARGTHTASEGSGQGRATGSEALKVFKQSLIATAEVSKDVWRDVRDVNHDTVKDLRHKVSELRHAWRDSAHGSASSSSTQPGSEASGATSRVEECFLLSGAFWVQPSTRANYAQLELPLPPALEPAVVHRDAAALEGTAPPAAAAVPKAVHMRVRKLGDRLARQTVGLVQQAKDLGQSLAAAGSGAAADEATKEVGDKACDGDSIFEIGSGDEAGGLSDQSDVEEGLDVASGAGNVLESDAGGIETATDTLP